MAFKCTLIRLCVPIFHCEIPRSARDDTGAKHCCQNVMGCRANWRIIRVKIDIFFCVNMMR
jgi:hypothetical protein